MARGYGRSLASTVAGSPAEIPGRTAQRLSLARGRERPAIRRCQRTEPAPCARARAPVRRARLLTFRVNGVLYAPRGPRSCGATPRAVGAVKVKQDARPRRGEIHG